MVMVAPTTNSAIPANTVEVRSITALRGPNLYAYMPVLHIVMDIGEFYDEHASNEFPGFVDRLVAWLPGLEAHGCSIGRPGGFIQRLQQGTYLPHICEHITLELQGLMGFDVAFGRARGAGEYGVYNVLIAYQEEHSARAAFDTALRLVLAAIHDTPFNFEKELEALLEVADEYRLGPSTGAIVAAAKRRNIPVTRLTPNGSLIQLGYGTHQKRIQASETSNTSSIAVTICQTKKLTNIMLRAVGIPVPDGRAVSSADEAWQVAQEIGGAVVIKPEDGNQGKGVSINLRTEDEIRQAYTIANNINNQQVLVERYIEGVDYRLLVVNGKLVAAARRNPASVVGDGKRTIAELVEEVNLDPRRRKGHSSLLSRINLDAAAMLVLAQQNLQPDSVPDEDQVVFLRNNSNLSTGGTATDVTDEVHPSNAKLAELAAQFLALDVAGVDMICHDISRPITDQNGAIVEVNAAPGLRMHLAPAYGTPRDVGKAIVDMLFPAESSPYIPIIAITGTNGKTTVTELISHIYRTAHWKVGMTSTEGVYINQERIMSGDSSGPRSAQAVLLHPHVEVAVLETARGGILREGLAFDKCTVGVVTNISADHLGLKGINTLEELAKVKQVVVEAIDDKGAAILNAEDPLVAEMAAATDAAVYYFGLDPHHHVIAAHIADGGAAVYVEEGSIVLADSNVRFNLIELERINFTHQGKILFQVQNALAAIAATWAAGVNPAMIARALTTFEPGRKMAAGRFSIQEIQDVEVIVDYGHNAGAIKALHKAVETLDKRYTIMAIGLPDDRRDEDLIATFVATLPFVDEYIFYELKDNHNRPPYTVTELLLQHLPADKPYHRAEYQPDAIEQAWQRLEKGQRLMIVADKVDEAQAVLDRIATSSEDIECLTSHTKERSNGTASIYSE